MSTDEPFDGNTTPGRDQNHGVRSTRRTPIPGEAGADDFIASLRDGRYQLVERVGAGAIGQVWRAQDTTLQREVAIKTINLATSADPSTEARFRREAVATAGLNHPNVVQIYDSGVDGHSAYIVMEFLHGPNLQAVVTEQGPIGWQAAMTMLAQVAAGLGAAHRFGVIHRDVKPANVVLTSDDLRSTPKLVDFGIARLNDQQTTALTSTMTAIGSAAYMSPEQAAGERVGPSSDMYSFGCLMMTVLTGQPPFPGESPVAVARAQVYDTPPLLRSRVPDAPASLENLVAALLTKQPEKRPGADEVVAALNAIQGDPQAPGLVAAPAPAAPAADEATMAMSSPTAFTEASTDMTAEGRTRVLPAGQDAAGSTAVDGLPPVAPAPTAGTTAAPVVGGGAAATGTGMVPAEAGGGRRTGRGRRIALVVAIVAVLAGLVALAWAQGRKSADPAPSQTITQTQTATTSSTATPTTQQSYDTAGTYQTGYPQQTDTGGQGTGAGTYYPQGNGTYYPQGNGTTYYPQGNGTYEQQATATGDNTQTRQENGTGDGGDVSDETEGE